MRQGAELGLRRLLLTVCTFVLFACLVAIYLVQFIPQDPLHLKTTLTVYVLFFVAMSCIGMAAAVKRNSALISIFAIHILLDSALLLIPRILLIRFSTSLPGMICSNGKYEEAPDDARSYSIEDQLMQFSSPAGSQGGCMLWMWSLDVAFIAIMLLQMGAQALLGVRLLGYSNYLNRQRRLEKVVDQQVC